MVDPSSSSSLADLLVAFKAGIGAWLVGTILASLLEGLLLQQVFRYFRQYRSDSRWLKSWVITVLVLQAFTVVLIIHTSYYYLATNWNNPSVFFRSDVWSAKLVPMIATMSNVASESYFARRVYTFGFHYQILVIVAMLLILAASGFYIAITAQAFEVVNIVQSADTGSWLPTAGAVLMFAGDVLLTGAFIHVLRQHRTENKRRDSMVDVLIAYAVSSGLLICVFNVLALILSVTFKHNIISTAALFIGEQVYSNSFLAALNTRNFLRSLSEFGNSGMRVGPGTARSVQTSGVAPDAVGFPSLVFATSASQSQSGSQSESQSADRDIEYKAAVTSLMVQGATTAKTSSDEESGDEEKHADAVAVMV